MAHERDQFLLDYSLRVREEGQPDTIRAKPAKPRFRYTAQKHSHVSVASMLFGSRICGAVRVR
eukprot:52457-Eustigmatos_ZCMA.PRE.1